MIKRFEALPLWGEMCKGWCGLTEGARLNKTKAVNDSQDWVRLLHYTLHITAPLPKIKLPQTLNYYNLKLNLQMNRLKVKQQKVSVIENAVTLNFKIINARPTVHA